MAYLNLVQFKRLSPLPPERIDSVEDKHSGFIEEVLEAYSQEIDARLAKRYPVPFANPPAIVKRWLAAMATVDVLERIGVSAQDPDVERYYVERARSLDSLKEASDGEKGTYELTIAGASPTSPATSAIDRGAPLSYSEQSPYVAFDRQHDDALTDDRNRRGR